jgi:hypothetical protein
LTAKAQEDVLIITAIGSRSLETVVAIAQEIKSLCEEHGVANVLVDVRGLEGRLRAADAFFLVIKHFKTFRDLRVIRKAAILDQNLSEDRHRFLENVAVNRGYNFKIFDDFDEAIEWLR